MFAGNIVEDLSRRTIASVSNIIEPLPDAFLSIGTGRNVKQSLISLGILHDGRCLPLYGNDDGALGLLKLFHEVTRAAAEGGQRLDVLGKVKHDSAPVNGTLLGAVRILRPRKADQLDLWFGIRNREALIGLFL
jgi:hypothetical protein